jgi:hypothetical protein
VITYRSAFKTGIYAGLVFLIMSHKLKVLLVKKSAHTGLYRLKAFGILMLPKKQGEQGQPKEMTYGFAAHSQKNMPSRYNTLNPL